MLDDRTCRICGCTDITACRHEDGTPCCWIEDDLCSACEAVGLTPALEAVAEECMRQARGTFGPPVGQREILVHMAAQLVRSIDALDRDQAAEECPSCGSLLGEPEAG